MKWNDYYRQFARFLPPNPKTILEIGVRNGDGLKYLSDTFPNAQIYGLDIQISKEAVDMAQGRNIKLARGNQMLAGLIFSNMQFDIIIDDGGHRPYQQAASFKQLFPLLNDGGVYVIEDMHMGQRLHYRLYGTFFGIRKVLHRMIDRMNKWYGGETPAWRSPLAIIFTPQLVIIEKGTTELKPA